MMRKVVEVSKNGVGLRRSATWRCNTCRVAYDLPEPVRRCRCLTCGGECSRSVGSPRLTLDRRGLRGVDIQVVG